jgi:protein-S-isoprenylcysteine O-methyltransferase Ste14
VPRALAAFGLITVLLHFTGIPLPGFWGYSIVTLMGVPMAFSHIALAIWLMVKGFDERHRPLSAAAHEVKLAGA